MSRFTDRVERDLTQIADHATPSSTAWESIQRRIAEQDTTEPTMEVIMLAPDPDKPRRRTPMLLLAGAALIAAVAIVAGLLVSGDDSDEPVITDQPDSIDEADPEVAPSSAPQLPDEGQNVTPGTYETDLLGMVYRIAVPEPLVVWTAQPNSVLLSDADPSASSPYAGAARTYAIARISGWNTPAEAVDDGYVGPGSLDPDDIDGWAAQLPLMSEVPACCRTVDTGEGSERVRTIWSEGKPALPLDVTLDPAATDDTFSCGEAQACLWAASVSSRGDAPRLGVDPLVMSGRFNQFWVIQVDGFDPFLVHISGPLGDEAWIDTVLGAGLDATLFDELDLALNGPFGSPDGPPAGE